MVFWPNNLLSAAWYPIMLQTQPKTTLLSTFPKAAQVEGLPRLNTDKGTGRTECQNRRPGVPPAHAAATHTEAKQEEQVDTLKIPKEAHLSG